MTIAVNGAVAALLKPTWGQKTIWQWHGMVDQKEAYFVNGKSFRLEEYIPAGCHLEVIAEAIGQAMHRHDATRTVLEIDDGELVGQVIEGNGEFCVDVYHAEQSEAASVAQAIAKRMSELPWTCREWPVRMAIVTVADIAAFLVMAHNRLVLDVQSLGFLMDDVGKLATGRHDELVPRWQIVQAAQFEQSAQAAALTAKAMQYSRSVLTAAPPSMFDFPPSGPPDTQFVMAQLESLTLARAVQLLRRRWRLAGGALVLAALAVVLGQYTGHTSVVVQMFAGNRTDRQRRHMLGTLISEGLLHIDLCGDSFAAIAREAARSIRSANQFAYCDPDALRAVREEVQLDTGAHLNLAIYYNDMQTAQEPSEEQPDLTEQEIAELTVDTSALSSPDTWTGWDRSWQAKVTRKDIRLLLTAQHGQSLPLLMYCDTTYLPRENMRQLVAGMELLLVTAAREGDVTSGDLAKVTGVAPALRGPSWIRCGNGWVDLAAVRTVWREVTGSGRCAVLAEEIPGHPGEHRLVGYLADADALLPAQLHRRFVAAFSDRDDIRAPHWYRCVDTGPQDLTDVQAWQRATVRTEGDGRG